MRRIPVPEFAAVVLQRRVSGRRHTSTVIAGRHYVEPDRSVDPTPAAHLECTVRLVERDGSLLANRPADREEELHAMLDRDGDVA